MASELENDITSTTGEQIFLCILIVFTFVIVLKRLNWEEIFLQNINAVHHVKSTQEVSMREVFNPFHISLSNENRSSISDGLNLQLSLLKPGFVSLFWEAEIDEFYKELQHPWEVLYNRIQKELFLGDKKVDVSHYSQRSQKCENLEWHTEIPDRIKQHGKAPPRSTYPVVVACTLEEPVAGELQIVIMLSVLHIKDPQVQLDSQVLHQFLITNDNKITTLNPFFVSTENSSTETETRSYYSDSEFQQCTGVNSEGRLSSHIVFDTCCVCQDVEMTIVLLPCRHGCVCSECVNKLDKCPVCRDIFTSYFRVKDSNQQASISGQRNIEHTVNPPAVLGDIWWERLNNRLNSFCGFN
ncbi:cell growth regulator with RING finger domain protein 1-like [Saccostrea echinata]|uniref:cell growth regulator with RING finger domain protein 1-like n=1 Tax=Saccostrea echinata TaxID=191078 RepID=UPI002A822735|nr:cell growth regulator with RING finger domain protein 1-like [Saccostrea echinata]